MSDFFKIVGERIKDYPQIKVGRTAEQFLQKAVLMRMGLTDMNALRDRYEGQSFLDNHRSRLFSNLAIREYLGEIVRMRSYRLVEDNENYIDFKDSRYEIIVAQFGTLPQFKRSEYKKDIILVFQRDLFWIHIVGIIESEEAINPDNFITRGNYKEFVAFDKAKRIK